MGLACLTSAQAGVWASEEALWTQAARVAPLAPRPWMNLARVAWAAGDLSTAEWRLDRARRDLHRQRPMEWEWANDWIDMTRARIRLQQGRFQDAAALMRDAPHPSERREICRQYAAICALSPLSGSP